MNQPATRARRPRDRKSQLATVAAELFRERGFHGVGINDIAAAAGVTGPALYRHFPDKRAILAHVLLSGITEMETATEQALSTCEAPAPEQIEALLADLARRAVERRAVMALWRWEGRNLAPEAQREIRHRSMAVLQAWTDVLCRRRPELRSADAELLCWAGMSVFGSVAVHRTTIAKGRFAQLLVTLAKRALHARLPDSGAAPVEALPALDLGTPSRREQVLAAATELFHRHGFAAVSMEDIGAAAGIAGPSVYRHFPSKVGLLAAIGRRAADRLAIGAEQALRTSAPPDEREALRRLVTSYVHTLTSTPELVVSFSTDAAHASGAERERADLVRYQREYVAQWVELLGVVHPDLGPREAKISVHAALTIANDATRTRRVSGRPGLAAELVTLMRAVLDIA
jgi:AcrR family transcriptional regulator